MRIRPKVFISLLVTALIPLLILGVFAYSTAVGGLRAQILKEVQNFASVQAQRIADLIGHERTQLSLVCSRTQLRLFLQDHLETPSDILVAKMDRILSDAKASLRSFDSISIAGPDGKIIATTNPAVLGSEAPDPETFAKALSGEFAHGFHARADSPLPEINVMGPLKLGGEVIGVASVALRPNDLVATLKTAPASGVESQTFLAAVQLDQSLQIIAPTEQAGDGVGILNRKGGRPIASSQDQNLPDAVTVDGTRVIAAVRDISGSDLVVVVAVPRDMALRPAHSLRNASLVILIAAFGFAAFVAFGLARSIADPIHALAESANRVVAEGDLYEEADESAPGEIGTLAESFNRMTGRLLRANRELEKTVAERTGQLESTQMVLIQAEKMESLGRLAAGVAHEVKNPLAIIQMGVDYLNGSTDPDDKNTLEMVAAMETAVAKADSIIHGMLDLTRSHGIERKLTDANKLMENALNLAGYELKKRKIEIVRDFESPLPEVRVDRTKFEQVFINIITNAAQAMNEGGTLYVKTFHSILKDAERQQGIRHFDRLRSRDGVVIFEFRDTGPGIPEDKLNKIFEPFYTTKAPGEGTGLGLGIAKTIIELHHGDLQVDNHPDGGARVRILIKVSDGGSTSFGLQIPKKGTDAVEVPRSESKA